MPVILRRANRDDTPFLARIMYTAARSHLSVCPWNAILEETEQGTLRLLQKIATTPKHHWCHVSGFWIAQVDNEPAAALCGFDPATEGSDVLAAWVLNVMSNEEGMHLEKLARIRAHLKISVSGLPEDLTDVWGIENVAVLPQYRGLGLIDQLFERAFCEGRERGFKKAQILCLNGNHRAETAWHRNGFAFQTDTINSQFEKLTGATGAKLLSRSI